MQWHSVSDFFHMGGYGLYVWGSFGLTAVALAGEAWLVHLRRQRILAALRNELLEEGTT
ncbi:MAG: heme exporter protein CcmD [Burkholderiales bacterium]|nr:heme exporter protein CcmD [Burkholderiales bacterium]